MFTGFPEETIRFFWGIRANNDKAYYKAHEDEFKQYVKKPFYDFIDHVAPAALDVDKDMEIRPVKCLSRIYRDTRFTKDKSPLRDHLWLTLRRSGESKENAVMYWFELAPEGANWGLGFWGDNRPALDQFRELMVKRPRRVLSTLKECGLPDEDGLRINGDSFKRMKLPEGLAPELCKLYSLKSFYIQRVNARLKDVYTEEIAREFMNDIRRLKPMYGLLRELSECAIASNEEGL